MLLRGLKSDTSYAVSVSAINQVGVGSAAKVRIMTSPRTGQYSYTGRPGRAFGPVCVCVVYNCQTK